MTIVIAILFFGFLIFIHELGHYITARIFNVGINEFALGMGPKIISKTSKKTGIVYSLRLLPIGGFVSMVGEDEESEDKNALGNKPVWQRMIIVAAGAVMNILVGVILVLCMVISSSQLSSNVVDGFYENSVSQKSGLMAGDEIVMIGSQKTGVGVEIQDAVMFEGDKPVDVKVIRNGKEVVLNDVTFYRVTEEELTLGVIDFSLKPREKNFINIIQHTYYNSASMINQIWKSLGYLVTGRIGIKSMSGPIETTAVMSETVKMGWGVFVYFGAFIALNLGVMNMLPFPALDGGRFIFMLYELIFKKPVNKNVEGYIHFAGMCLLLLLMLFVCVNDVGKLFR